MTEPPARGREASTAAPDHPGRRRGRNGSPPGPTKVVVAPAPPGPPQVTRLSKRKRGAARAIALGLLVSVVFGFAAWSITSSLLGNDQETATTGGRLESTTGGIADDRSGTDDAGGTGSAADDGAAPITEATTTTVEATTTTVRPTTTTIAVANPSDGSSVAVLTVALQSADGAMVPGIGVELSAEENDRQIAATTSANSPLALAAEPGCYTLQLTVRAGYRVPPEEQGRQVCLKANLAQPVLATVELVDAEPPSGCRVEPRGAATRGIDIFEAEGRWADFYIFYNFDQVEVFRTDSRLPDEDEANRRQWYGQQGRVFFVGSVASATAVRNGEESLPAICGG